MVKLLLKYGANSAIRDKNDMTALMWAEKKKYNEIISLLETN